MASHCSLTDEASPAQPGPATPLRAIQQVIPMQVPPLQHNGAAWRVQRALLHGLLPALALAPVIALHVAEAQCAAADASASRVTSVLRHAAIILAAAWRRRRLRPWLRDRRLMMDVADRGSDKPSARCRRVAWRCANRYGILRGLSSYHISTSHLR